MAAEWVKVEKTTPSKIEVLHIASILNIHPDQAFGMCFRFWVWCDDNMTDCHAAGVTTARLNLALGVTGFAEAMIEAGWLETDGESISVPKFDRHLSQSSKRRALSSNRQKACRAASVTKAQPKCDKSAPKALPEGEGEGEILETHTPAAEESGRVPLAESFSAYDAGVVCVEIDGELVSYDQNSLAWEAEFIRQWNAASGTIKHSRSELSIPHRNLLRARLSDPNWRWKLALSRFPLWSETGWIPGLMWFLKEGSVQGILEGQYHRKPQTKGKRNERQVSNPGQTYDPVAASLDTRPLDEV